MRGMITNSQQKVKHHKSPSGTLILMRVNPVSACAEDYPSTQHTSGPYDGPFYT